MLRVKKFAVVVAMALLSVSLWTASPVFAVWVGSKVQGSGPPSMAAILVVVAVLLATTLVIARGLSFLSAIDDQLSGRTGPVRQRYPWLESIRGERHDPSTVRLSALERVLVGVVVVAFIAFQVWFFFLAGAPFATG